MPRYKAAARVTITARQKIAVRHVKRLLRPAWIWPERAIHCEKIMREVHQERFSFS